MAAICQVQVVLICFCLLTYSSRKSFEFYFMFSFGILFGSNFGKFRHMYIMYIM